MPRILFVTPFKPYGIDNVYSRVDNFPECFHNRTTRAQGIFSYRGHFSVFGLHVIANNISAESRVLEYPTLERFRRELKRGYDYVGIGSVVPNLQKVRVMAEEVRRLSPKSKIVVGGYCANIDDIRRMMPIDYLCTGEGISFMRELLGEPAEFEFKNPDVFSRAHSIMGVPLFGRKNPHIVVGLGCPYGCEYCSPSHLFGRKYHRFYKDGASLFAEMEKMEKKHRSRTFGFIGDDNFLIDLKRAEELRQRVVASGKFYEIFFFASSEKIQEFGPARLAELGANIVWIGRESCFEDNKKNRGVDHRKLTEQLHAHGIKVAVSTMLLMDQHTPENIEVDFEGHLELRPDFSMFSFLSPLPGTPIYKRYKEENRILWGFPYEDWNGLKRPFSYHPKFTPDQAVQIRDRFLDREFEALGPSLMRWIRTERLGYQNLKDSESAALRLRARTYAGRMPRYKSILWAVAKLSSASGIREMVERELKEVEKEFGPITAFEKTLGAGLVAFGTKQILRQKFIGDVYQPPTTVADYPVQG